MKRLMFLIKNAVVMTLFLMLGSIAKASEKLGTVHCSLIQGAFNIVKGTSAEITKNSSYKQLSISNKGYSCGAVGMISDILENGNTCYEASIVEPSIGIPSGTVITLNNHRDFVSSLNSSDGYHCECIVKMNKSLQACQ